MKCSNCGLELPSYAHYCARCGFRLPPGTFVRPGSAAPIWVQVLLWLGAGALFWVAVIYTAVAAGLIPTAGLTVGADPASLRTAAALIAASAASLAAAHAIAAYGLTRNRPWARTFATLVCVVWFPTCVGLPLGILAISAMWRSRSAGGPMGPAASSSAP